jgi:hypothetical protein
MRTALQISRELALPAEKERDMKRVYAGMGRRLLLILALLVMTADGHGHAGKAGSGTVTPSIPEMTEALTPLVLEILTPPHPVPGSDRFFHLVYEFQVTNASSLRRCGGPQCPLPQSCRPSGWTSGPGDAAGALAPSWSILWIIGW